MHYIMTLAKPLPGWDSGAFMFRYTCPLDKAMIGNREFGTWLFRHGFLLAG